MTMTSRHRSSSFPSCARQASRPRRRPFPGIIKELGSTGAYRYSVSAKPVEHTFSAKLNIIFKQCLTSVEHAQNILVIKTMPGLASAACSALDKMNIPEIVGTLAGDDTAFIAMRDSASASTLCAELREQITH